MLGQLRRRGETLRQVEGMRRKALEPEAVDLDIGPVRHCCQQLGGHVVRAVRRDRQVERLSPRRSSISPERDQLLDARLQLFL